MEYANKAIELINKAASNNKVINSFLGITFVALSLKSFSQQKNIETLETHKDSLLKSNKAIKTTIWDWKQQLYAQAQAQGSSVIPIDKIKAIFGDAPTTPPGICVYFMYVFVNLGILLKIGVEESIRFSGFCDTVICLVLEKLLCFFNFVVEMYILFRSLICK